MRILYIDIDCLRPDHLGCYGYHRATSPCIDDIAARGLRWNNVYVSDAPCLPSRTALFSGRFGIHTGVVNHGGAHAEMFVEGPQRGFASKLNLTSWMRALRNAGFHTATVSPFGERHSAWHWYANFNEIHNPGRRGLEIADDIMDIAVPWLKHKGTSDNWFLHLNFWDPHMPYRTPTSFGNPFAKDPPPAWLSEEVRERHWDGVGPHSAREVIGYSDRPPEWLAWDYPRQPLVIDSPGAVRALFDGYDTGIRYADAAVGQIVDILDRLGVLDDTAIIVSGDHGEHLGEFNIYGDHQCADHCTSRVPLIISWPGITDTYAGQARDALHYQVDAAATVTELAGGSVAKNWDGRSFAQSLNAGSDVGRPYLVLSQAAWSLQRAVRFSRQLSTGGGLDDGLGPAGEYICIRSYHDGHHCFDEYMLFELTADPHEEHNLAGDRPALVRAAMAHLESWHGDMMRTATHGLDPMWAVLREGGPKHVRGQLPAYIERLRATGRGHWADELARRHPHEVVGDS